MASNQNLFEFVKSQVNISDYVRSLSNVKGLHSTGGSRWRCNNVISNGSNPAAMMLDDETGFFKVFSHGNESGDIITLFSLMNGGSLSPREAAIGLASEMGVTIDPELLRSKGGGVSKTELSESMDKLSMMTHDYLMNSDSDDAIKAREYLNSRGMPEDMMKEWRIGLFPSSMDHCLDMISQCGTVEIFEKTGIVTGNDRPFVAMSGRICFPIFSSYGKCISFSSRSVPDIHCYNSDSKYINTSSTSLYHKREVLYGMHLYKRNVTKTLIICEGNMDVLALNYQTPEDVMAVATCGTALTSEHVSWIRKGKFDRVIINFDSDDAGQDATSKVLWMINVIDNVYVKSKGTGKDPWDSFEAGEEYNHKESLSPMITYVAKYASHKGKQGMIDWFVQAYHSLSFESDRDALVSELQRLTKASRSFLLSHVNQDPHQANYNRQHIGDNPDDGIQLSPGVETVISAMLSVPLEERKILFFPFYSRRTVNKAIMLSNIRTKDDVTAMRMAMGLSKDASEDIISYVSSLMPSSDEESTIRLSFCSMHLSNRIKGMIASGGINSGYSLFISPLSNISGGIPDNAIPVKESLFMVMNAVNSIQ